ncbi:hypothetical protein [Nonomuraea sp. NPDC049709]|uniref:hypothetical protein n=1 Tax=Nonomuraea sp. NPDC049709 TaxID=3154736 RepID=UPI0034305708
MATAVRDVVVVAATAGGVEPLRVRPLKAAPAALRHFHEKTERNLETLNTIRMLQSRIGRTGGTPLTS